MALIKIEIAARFPLSGHAGTGAGWMVHWQSGALAARFSREDAGVGAAGGESVQVVHPPDARLAGSGGPQEPVCRH